MASRLRLWRLRARNLGCGTVVAAAAMLLAAMTVIVLFGYFAGLHLGEGR